MNIRRGFGLIFPEHRLTLMGGNDYTGQRNTYTAAASDHRSRRRESTKARPEFIEFLGMWNLCRLGLDHDRFPQLIIQSINLSR